MAAAGAASFSQPRLLESGLTELVILLIPTALDSSNPLLAAALAEAEELEGILVLTSEVVLMAVASSMLCGTAADLKDARLLLRGIGDSPSASEAESGDIPLLQRLAASGEAAEHGEAICVAGFLLSLSGDGAGSCLTGLELEDAAAAGRFRQLEDEAAWLELAAPVSSSSSLSSSSSSASPASAASCSCCMHNHSMA